MRITFLIGNGFDLNIGKKTSYRDFYKYYLNQPSQSVLIENLKKDLNQNYKNWSDLELGLGKYTKKINTIDEFDLVLDDIKDNLSNFIGDQEIDYDITDQIMLDYYSNLTYPEKVLTRRDKENIEIFKNRFDSYWYVDIISFNYSLSVERLLKYENVQKKMYEKPNADLNSIRHIHGYFDRRMIVGVNDSSQLFNEGFRNNPNITGSIIKPEFNRNIRDLVDNDCLSIIKSSNIICLFGLSIGDTDKIWWESIGNRLLIDINCILIIFFKGDDIPKNRENLIIRKENEIKNMFIEKINISKEQSESIKDRIYIGYNTDLFKIDSKFKNEIQTKIHKKLKIEDTVIV